MSDGTATSGRQARRDEHSAAALNLGCQHYWEIETAVSQVSRGICRLCGSCREFPNYLQDCVTTEKKERYHEWFSAEERQGMLLDDLCL